MTNRLLTFVTAALAVFGVAACTDSGAESPLAPEAAEGRFDNNGNRPDADEPTIADIVVAAAQPDDEGVEAEFTILLLALQETGLDAALAGRGQYTVFAPTDAAFAALLDASDEDDLETPEDLLNSPALEDILRYHVAPGRRPSDDVLDSDEIPTLQGHKIFPVSTDDGPAIRDTNAGTPDALLQVDGGIDIGATNGIIHTIDQVLLFGDDKPEDDDDDDESDDDEEDYDDDESDDDESEDDDESDDDESDDDDDSEDEEDDYDEEEEERDSRTIAQLVADAADAGEGFTFLRAALDAAGLTPVLDGKRQFTVFAPTDAAFETAAVNLGFVTDPDPETEGEEGEGDADVVGLVEYLVSNDLLEPVLLYHVAPGRRNAEDVLESEEIRTLQGGFLFPELQGEMAFLVDTSDGTEDAEILAADIQQSNGVVHVISEVLLPLNVADLP